MLGQGRKKPVLANNILISCSWAVGVIILLLRAFYKLKNPIPLYEDGVWAAQLYTEGFYKTFFAGASYYVFGDILLVWIAKEINLLLFGQNIVHIGLIMIVVADVVYAGVATIPFLCLSKEMHLVSKLFIWSAIIMLPFGTTAYEMIGVINNLGYVWYVIAVSALYYMYIKKPSNHYTQFICAFLVFLGCNTNPVSYLFVFLFVFRMLIQEWRLSGNHLRQFLPCCIHRYPWLCGLCASLIITSCGIICRVMRGGALQGEGLPGYGNLIEYLLHSALFPFVFHYYDALTDIKALLLIVLFLLLIISTLKIANASNELFLLRYVLFSFMLLVIAVFYMRPGLASNLMGNYTSSYPERYYYTQNILAIFIIGIAFDVALKQDRTGGGIRALQSLCGFGFAAAMLFSYIAGGDELVEIDTTPYYSISSNLTSMQERIDAANLTEDDRYRVDMTVWTHFSMELPKEIYAASYCGVRNGAEVDLDQMIKLKNFTDVNWENGFRRGALEAIFEKTQQNLEKLEVGNVLTSSDGSKLRIVAVNEGEDAYGAVFEQVSDSIGILSYMYPNLLYIQRKP